MFIRLLNWTEEACARLGTSAAAVREVCWRVVPARTGRHLTLLLYALEGTGAHGEYVPGWWTPQDIHGGTVPGLPARSLVIRVGLGCDNTYPHATHDAYGWAWRFQGVLDQLALLIAHELYHLSQPSFARQRASNEQHANAYAVKHVQDLGFAVTGGPDDGR
jgi:hypothetical protein